MAEYTEREELARNSHDVASSQQVTEALRPKVFRNSAESLATEKQVTSNWISVEDRLPECGHTRVLVHLIANVPQGGSPREDTDRFLDGKWVRWNGRVTHWMPLPDPPKEEV